MVFTELGEQQSWSQTYRHTKYSYKVKINIRGVMGGRREMERKGKGREMEGRRKEREGAREGGRQGGRDICSLN